MDITFIYHSCFLVETAECYYLFDYYKGKLPPLDTDKPMLVFASHSHQDHYNPALFSLLREMGMKKIGAVLSNDIKSKNYPAGGLLSPEHIFKVYHSQEYELPCHTRIRTLLSTDSGVAFLLTCPEGTFYHAGDLNDWITEDTPEAERRQMTGSFRAALRPLKDISIDYACLPLDPHLGCHYADGFLYFLKNINAKKVYPMHFWDKPEIVTQFLKEYPEYRGHVIVFPES